MKLQFIQPLPELKPFIIKFWLFENDSGFINHGTLVAPNAKPKIIIPFKNDISATDANKTDYCTEGDICFIGIRDTPVTLKTPAGPSGSIGIEFRSEGAYKFLKSPMHELTNSMFSFSDIYGKKGKELQGQVLDEENPILKINIIQQFLIGRFHYNNRNNLIVNHSVQHIAGCNGLTTIKEIERKTGYSNRYLQILFKDYLGISPKTLAIILRFQKLYKILNIHGANNLCENSIYDLYYDQAHFIKEFKRFTGFTPFQYSRFNNDFGKVF